MTTPDGDAQHGTVRAIGAIGLATLVSRVFGYARDILVARAFGAGPATDAFFVAFRIPNLLRRLFAEGALSTGVVPVLSETWARGGPEAFARAARAVAGTGLVVLGGVTVLGVLLAPWVVTVMAPGWRADPSQLDLAVRLTRVMFPYLALIGLAALCMGVLNTRRRFFTSALSPAVLNVAMILAVLLLARRVEPPILALAVGVLVGGLAQVVVQLPEVRRVGLPLSPTFEWGHPAVRLIARRLGPAVFGLAVVQITVLVNTLLASLLEHGAVSYLYYADRVMEFPLGVFGIALATAALPEMSQQAARGERPAFRATLGFALRVSAFVARPGGGRADRAGRPDRAPALRARRVHGRGHPADRPGPGRLRGGTAGVLGRAHRRADLLCARRHAHAGARGARRPRRQRGRGGRPHGPARPRGARVGLIDLGVRQRGDPLLAPAPPPRRPGRARAGAIARADPRRIGPAGAVLLVGRDLAAGTPAARRSRSRRSRPAP